MRFIFQPVDEATVRTFLGWRYDPPYDIYNPNPDGIEDDLWYFMDPKNACYGVTDDAGNLVAYCTFGPDGQVPGGDYSSEALDIGLGVRPDLTGKGRGWLYVGGVLDFAGRTFAPKAFRVTVAEFNKRALLVWERAGFTRVQRFKRKPDGRPFVVLMRDAP